jgi:hypothetical protein
MRIIAVLHDASFLAQPDALLRPPLSRWLIRGLGEQEVLDSRQNVRDLALAIDQLDWMLEVSTHDPSRTKREHIWVPRKRKARGEAGRSSG